MSWCRDVSFNASLRHGSMCGQLAQSVRAVRLSRAVSPKKACVCPRHGALSCQLMRMGLSGVIGDAFSLLAGSFLAVWGVRVLS